MAEAAAKKRGRKTNAEIIAEAEAQKAAETAKPEFLEKHLAGFVQQPFELLADKTGYEGFKLPDEDAAACAPHVKVILDHYAPAMNPITAAWLSLAVALGPHAWKSFRGYRRWSAEQPPTPDPVSAAVAAHEELAAAQ